MADEPAKVQEGFTLTPKAIGPLVIGVVALILVFSNTARVTLRFLWISISAPGWTMLLFVLMAGFLWGWMFGRRRYKKS